MEHRWGRRSPADLPVHLVLADGAVAEGRLRNVSVTGAFVETQHFPAMLSPIFVQPNVDESQTLASERLPACVVRHTANGIGLEWSDASGKAREVVRRYELKYRRSWQRDPQHHVARLFRRLASVSR